MLSSSHLLLDKYGVSVVSGLAASLKSAHKQDTGKVGKRQTQQQTGVRQAVVQTLIQQHRTAEHSCLFCISYEQAGKPFFSPSVGGQMFVMIWELLIHSKVSQLLWSSSTLVVVLADWLTVSRSPNGSRLLCPCPSAASGLGGRELGSAWLDRAWLLWGLAAWICPLEG